MGRVNFNRQTDIVNAQNILDDEKLDQKLSGKSNFFGTASSGVKRAQSKVKTSVDIESGAKKFSPSDNLGKFGAAAKNIVGSVGAASSVIDLVSAKNTGTKSGSAALSGAIQGASTGLSLAAAATSAGLASAGTAAATGAAATAVAGAGAAAGAGASSGAALGPIGAGVGALVGVAAGLIGAAAARKKEGTRIEVEKINKLGDIAGQSGKDESNLLMRLGQNMRIT